MDLYLQAEEIVRSQNITAITTFRNSLTTPYDTHLFDLMCHNPKFPESGRGFVYRRDLYNTGTISLSYQCRAGSVAITATDKEGTATLTDFNGNTIPNLNSPLINSLAEYFSFQIGCQYL